MALRTALTTHKRMPDPMTRDERERLIEQYADGPSRLRQALAKVPEEARKGRPGPGGGAPPGPFDYQNPPLETALATVEAVRANTAAVIRRLPEEAWTREGRHTESGPHTAEDWLKIYAAPPGPPGGRGPPPPPPRASAGCRRPAAAPRLFRLRVPSTAVTEQSPAASRLRVHPYLLRWPRSSD